MKSLFIFSLHLLTVCLVIVLLAHPAEVVRSVVQCVAVYMIHGGAALRVRVGAPRLSHQAADKKMVCLAELAKAHSIIAFIVHERRQEPRVCVFQAFDASHVRAKILAAIALYGLPGFTWQIWYSIHLNTSLLKNLTERTFMCVRLCVWITAPNRGELFSAPFTIIV